MQGKNSIICYGSISDINKNDAFNIIFEKIENTLRYTDLLHRCAGITISYKYSSTGYKVKVYKSIYTQG